MAENPSRKRKSGELNDAQIGETNGIPAVEPFAKVQKMSASPTDKVDRHIPDSSLNDSVVIVDEPIPVINLENCDTSIEVSQGVIEILDDDSFSGHKSDSDVVMIESDTKHCQNRDEFIGPVDKPNGVHEHIAEDSIALMSFSSKETFDKYKSRILDALKNAIEFSYVENSDDCSLTISVDPNIKPEEWCVVPREMPQLIDDTHCNSSKNDEPVQTNSNPKARKELFMLDANPCTEDTIAVRYCSKFSISNALPKTDTAAVQKPVSYGPKCFNCDGAHTLRDCQIPKDMGRINRARMSHKPKSASVRYHLDEDQKFSHLKPGKISDNLQCALGLRPKQIPPFVYRMRVLGYPPGWIHEATEETSCMAVIGIDGQKIEKKHTQKSYFNESRIVEYPGFNVPMVKGMKDEYRNQNVPPFSKDHSKEAMIAHIRNLEAQANDNLEAQDMDISTEDGGVVCVDDTSNPSSNGAKEEPSLNDLEARKMLLLAELNDQTTSSSQDASPLETSPKVDCIEGNTDSNSSLHNTTLTGAENPCAELLHSTPNQSLKLTDFGTPVIKSASPYSHLPHLDNFMVGVSPVINFENLPNSTGKYDQMSNVISRVRKTMKSLNETR